jgi:outer membrane immunogenic protein
MKKFLLVAVAVTLSTPAMAQYDDAVEAPGSSGARIELRGMYETPTISSVIETNDIFKIGNGIAYGGEVGYDFKAGESFSVGPYVTYEKSSVEGFDDVGDGFIVNDNLAAGVRVGIAAGNRGKIYGKLGYAKLKLTAVVNEAAGRTETPGSGEGVQGAVGYELGFGKNFYGSLELGYADNGKIGGINFQRRHAGIGLGVRF